MQELKRQRCEQPSFPVLQLWVLSLPTSIKQWDAETSELMSKVIPRRVGSAPINNTSPIYLPPTTFQEAVLLPGPVRLAQKTSGWCKLSLLQHTLLMSCLWLTADPRRRALEQTLHNLSHQYTLVHNCALQLHISSFSMDALCECTCVRECASKVACVFHDRLIYHSSDPAGACWLLCKTQSCAWLGKGLGFLGIGSHQIQLEYDTQWPQEVRLVMSFVWLTFTYHTASPSFLLLLIVSAFSSV